MAARVEVTTKPLASAISLLWIISARDDLIWFIGSVVSSYLLLFLYVTGILPLVPMAAMWAILIDAPHVFGTFSRTYFDRSEWKTRRRLMLGSLLFFVVGPAMVLAGLGITFFFLAALWAYYHLVKQHYGFMVLYKKKNQDLAPVDNGLDRVFLLVAFNYPFVAFIAGKNQEAYASLNRKHVLASVGTTLVAVLSVALYQWSVGNIGRKSETGLCSEFCQGKGYVGSGMPPRNAGAPTCSCFDAQGREAVKVPMEEVTAGRGK